MRLDEGKMEELRDRILELNGKRLSELDEVQLKLYGTALSYNRKFNRKLELLIISKQINENDSIIYIGKFDGLCTFGQEEGKS
ncbi:hypothetical protein HMPREF3050_09095 [Neisseria sp. HMSC065D04]|uniref:hypothetical protein n=1 Tax=Neisseria sp. HMSC065D04 TaxID=1739542 RepID=UPI0008A384A3|nr:hypothetical protein [Neisseria sp. HMSC065D04]OFO29635.1 hypothetical protein HMPREF3050_09095 [Neisseria sp. HMSC065D04]